MWTQGYSTILQACWSLHLFSIAFKCSEGNIGTVNFISSLNSTGRSHSCPGELLAFSCSGEGNELILNINGAEFTFDDSRMFKPPSASIDSNITGFLVSAIANDLSQRNFDARSLLSVTADINASCTVMPSRYCSTITIPLSGQYSVYPLDKGKS